MRPLLFALALLAATPAAPAAEAAETEVSRTVTDAGLIGRWSTDCNAAPDDRTIWLGFSADDVGVVRMREDRGSWNNTERVIAARRGDDGRISVTVVLEDAQEVEFDDTGPLDVTYLVEGDRLRTWSSRTDKGEVLIDKGMFQEGRPTPWFQRCPSL